MYIAYTTVILFNYLFMELLKLFLTFLVGFATIIVWDVIWLWHIMKDFIVRSFWDLIVVENGAAQINLPVGLMAWAVIALMILIFVTKSWYATSYKSALAYGAILGACLYAVYDFTNLTFLKDYSVQFTIVDIIWGAVICSIVSLTMYLFSNWINKIP